MRYKVITPVLWKPSCYSSKPGTLKFLRRKTHKKMRQHWKQTKDDTVKRYRYGWYYF